MLKPLDTLMVIKEGKKDKEETTLHRLKDVLLERFSSVVIENIADRLHELMRKLQDLIYLTQKKIIEHFYVSGFFFTGCIFIALSILFYLTDAIHWSRSKATFVTGVLFFALSIAIKQYVLKTRSI